MTEVEKKDDEAIKSYYDGKNTYKIGDTVYIESQRSDMPYFICTIRDFKKSKKDHITIEVTWYYRPCEIPTSVYQLLLQDRSAEHGSASHGIWDNPIVKDRELFISDAIDMYPVSALRGRASCVPFSEVKENVIEYISCEDNWFYILRYNHESRRMANAKGEIRIGVSHQAILPPFVPLHERNEEELKELEEACNEDLYWRPASISTQKLKVYLRAARSITSYNNFRDKQDGGAETAVASFSKDVTSQHAYNLLHKHDYDISAALNDIIRHPIPKQPLKPWTDEERKKFTKGLRSYGKAFHKIRKECLPERPTAELIRYYYVWKKTPNAQSSTRTIKKGGRRNNLVRKTRTVKPKTPVESEFLELSSCSDSEFNVCDDTDHERDLSLYACRHCYTTQSPNWHHAGKSKLLLCDGCRMYFKRYGRMKCLTDKREPPAYIYKAAFANLDDNLQNSGRMRTRRSSTPVFTSSNSVRSRILQEAKLCNQKQITLAGVKPEETKSPAKRRNSREEEQEPAKKARVEDDEDADDEADCESENESESRSEGGQTSGNSNLETPSPETTMPVETPAATSAATPPVAPPPPAPQQAIKEEPMQADEQQKIASEEEAPQPVKLEEEIKQEEAEEEVDDTPAAPDDPANKEKEAQRFQIVQKEPSCARCAMIYVYKRPVVPKTEADYAKRREEDERMRAREMELRNRQSPTRLQPAQISSQYQANMQMFAHRNDLRHDPHHPWFGGYPVPTRSPRNISPPEYINEPGKIDHLLKIFDRGPGEHRAPPHGHPHVNLPPPSAFTPRPNEHHDYRPASARSHISSHVPAAIENLSRIPSGLNSIDRYPGLDRPPTIDPATGLPPIQPHVHSHLHTHTHLHVHPDDLKYRRGSHVPAEPPERHEHNFPHQAQPPIPPPNSRPRSREYHDQLLKYPELLAQMHHEQQLRESIARNIPPGKEAILNNAREGAVSPSIPHEVPTMHNDPVTYHLWLTHTRMQQRWGGHGVPPHSQAPELSPHGLPQHPHHLKNEREKIIHEKLVHEKLLNAEREKQRSMEGEKYMRHHVMKPPHEGIKFKPEHLHERPPSLRVPDIHPHRTGEASLAPGEMHPRDPRDIHSNYHNSMFMRRMQGAARDPRHERSLPPERSLQERSLQERAMHERTLQERSLQERSLQERTMQERSMQERSLQERSDRSRFERMERERQELERLGHTERAMFHDRVRLERPSLFDHFQKPPETIDLSEE